MKVKVEHTPLPWKYTKNNDQRINDFLIHDKENRHIAEVFMYQNHENKQGPSEANASFIALACNNFYELLEACKEAHQWIESGSKGIVLDVKDSLRLSIKQAEKEG